MANSNTPKTEKKKMSKKVLWTRILCIALAFLMVAGGLFAIIESFLHTH